MVRARLWPQAASVLQFEWRPQGGDSNPRYRRARANLPVVISVKTRQA